MCLCDRSAAVEKGNRRQGKARRSLWRMVLCLYISLSPSTFLEEAHHTSDSLPRFLERLLLSFSMAKPEWIGIYLLDSARPTEEKETDETKSHYKQQTHTWPQTDKAMSAFYLRY